MIKASQIRAARGLAGLGQKELAEQCDISVATLRRMESDQIGPERSNAGAVHMVCSILESYSVQFLDDGDVSQGPGVSLK